MKAERMNGELRFFVAECMEFHHYGAYFDDLSLEEAVRRYKAIDGSILNAGKGIGFVLNEPESIFHEGEWELVHGDYISFECLEREPFKSREPLILELVKRVCKLMPEIQFEEGSKYKKEDFIQIFLSAKEMAKQIDRLQQEVDGDMYLLQIGEVLDNRKIIQRELLTEGKQIYLEWLTSLLQMKYLGETVLKTAKKLKHELETAEMAWEPGQEPLVKICMSEAFENGMIYTLGEAQEIFKKEDEEMFQKRIPGEAYLYEKTRYKIYFREGGTNRCLEGYQDFGDGYGSLLENLRDCIENHMIGNQCLTEQKGGGYQPVYEKNILTEKILPYLQFHIDLHQLENEIKELSKEDRPATEVTKAVMRNYAKETLRYIEECRVILNEERGEKHFPEPPYLGERKLKKSSRERQR